jgi:nucleolar protein 58
LLDDLDKELNQYAMRVKEWYGWHFPELARIINDNVAYSRFILATGMRSNTASTDLSDVLPEEIEAAVKSAAEISMGTEITTEDLENIQALAESVVSLTEYRTSLSSYLATRMQAIAPNLTALVGELIGARLIAHAGSLMNLAKAPGSTIQILGAEKALFRALKTKHDTPKYGLLFHASLVGQATGRNKGKIARMLASKAALGVRVDSLSEWGVGGEGEGAEPTEEEKSFLGVQARRAIEHRLKALEGKSVLKSSASIAPPSATSKKWEIKEAKKYNKDADGLTGEEPPAAAAAAGAERTKTLGHRENGVDASDDVDDDESDDDASDDESEVEVTKAPKKVNGEGKSSKDDKRALKEAKLLRKAERAAKREAKEAKKEAKRKLKKSTKAEKAEKKQQKRSEENKKRKRDDEDEPKGEKKKKKKSKSEA